MGPRKPSLLRCTLWTHSILTTIWQQRLPTSWKKGGQVAANALPFSNVEAETQNQRFQDDTAGKGFEPGPVEPTPT